eukprot:1902388-Prymnesium_polylepis.1
MSVGSCSWSTSPMRADACQSLSISSSSSSKVKQITLRLCNCNLAGPVSLATPLARTCNDGPTPEAQDAT